MRNSTTALAVAPVGVAPATLDPDADPLIVQVGGMKTAELKTWCRVRYAQGQQLAEELVVGLNELESRCKTAKIWHNTLLECGINPGTWRSWRCRDLNRLTTGKRTRSRKHKTLVTKATVSLAEAKAKVDAVRAAASAPVDAEYVDEDAQPVPHTDTEEFSKADIADALDWMESQADRTIEPEEEDYQQAQCIRWLIAKLRLTVQLSDPVKLNVTPAAEETDVQMYMRLFHTTRCEDYYEAMNNLGTWWRKRFGYDLRECGACIGDPIDDNDWAWARLWNAVKADRYEMQDFLTEEDFEKDWKKFGKPTDQNVFVDMWIKDNIQTAEE
jgi:hypothetical protein